MNVLIAVILLWLLGYRGFQFDEDKGADLDGMTICESITFIFTCGQSSKIPEYTKDDYDYKFEEPTEEQ